MQGEKKRVMRNLCFLLRHFKRLVKVAFFPITPNATLTVFLFCKHANKRSEAHVTRVV